MTRTNATTKAGAVEMKHKLKKQMTMEKENSFGNHVKKMMPFLGLEKSYTEEDVEKIITYTKHLEYLDGTKSQKDITSKEILNKWEEKYR